MPRRARRRAGARTRSARGSSAAPASARRPTRCERRRRRRGSCRRRGWPSDPQLATPGGRGAPAVCTWPTRSLRSRGHEDMSAKIVGPRDGKAGDLGSLGVRFMAWASETGGGFALVEHPIPPRALAAPLHRHSREDEYSFVLEGRMGADLGGGGVFAGPGALALPPGGEWENIPHGGDEACRVLAILSPRGGARAFQGL